VKVDDKVRYNGCAGSTESAAARFAFQTSVSGVFAIGDVRSSSIKRVASAVGEGAAVVSEIHTLLTAER